MGEIQTWQAYQEVGQTGFLEKCLVPQSCQCYRGIWTMLSITNLNFSSLLKQPSSWTRWSLETCSKWNILFYSIYAVLGEFLYSVRFLDLAFIFLISATLFFSFFWSKLHHRIYPWTTFVYGSNRRSWIDIEPLV